MSKQYFVTFSIPEELHKRGKNIPRSFNISKELREAYKKILKQCGV